jgi:hypothetical protein
VVEAMSQVAESMGSGVRMGLMLFGCALLGEVVEDCYKAIDWAAAVVLVIRSCACLGPNEVVHGPAIPCELLQGMKEQHRKMTHRDLLMDVLDHSQRHPVCLGQLACSTHAVEMEARPSDSGIDQEVLCHARVPFCQAAP